MPENVFINGKGIAGQVFTGKTIAASPDVCWSPPLPPMSPTAVPYANTAAISDLAKGSAKVLVGDKPVALADKSYMSKSTGNEAATQALLKGVLSKNLQGSAYFVMWSSTVQGEGLGLPGHVDPTTNNHNQKSGNTPPAPFMASAGAGAVGTIQYDTPTDKRCWKLICKHRKEEDKLQPTNNIAIYAVVCTEKVSQGVFSDTIYITSESKVEVKLNNMSVSNEFAPTVQYSQLPAVCKLGKVFEEIKKFSLQPDSLRTQHALLITNKGKSTCTSAVQIYAYPDAHYELEVKFERSESSKHTSRPGGKLLETGKSINTLTNRGIKKSPTLLQRDVWLKVADKKSKLKGLKIPSAPDGSSINVTLKYNNSTIEVDILSFVNIKKTIDAILKSIQKIIDCIPKIGLFFCYEYRLFNNLSLGVNWGFVETSTAGYHVCKYREIKLNGEIFYLKFEAKFGFEWEDVVNAYVFFRIEMSLSAILEHRDPPKKDDDEMTVGAEAKCIPAVGAVAGNGKVLAVEARVEWTYELRFDLNVNNQYSGFGEIEGKYSPLKAIIVIQSFIGEYELGKWNFFSGGKLPEKMII